MNDTENYLAHIKSELWKRLLRSFFCYFAEFFVLLAVSYIIFSHADLGRYTVAANVTGEGFWGGIKNAVVSLAPCVTANVVIYFSTYSSLCPLISAVLCAIKAGSLGAFCGLTVKNSLGGIGSHWHFSVWLYFIETCLFIVLIALSVLYSGALTYTFGREEKQYYRSLAAEYTKCFFICSGALFIIGCVRAAFITI